MSTLRLKSERLLPTSRRQATGRLFHGSLHVWLELNLLLAGGAGLALLDAGRLEAAETGTLRGAVRDGATQGPLEGVQVVLEGAGLPGGRTRVTDAKGGYWFPVIPPGDYRLTFSKDGFQTRGVDCTVKLDQTTSIPPLELNLLTYTTEAIEVVETAPVIDSTRSAVGEAVDEDYFARLPVGRSYQSVIQTLPGISGRINYSSGGPSNGNPSVRGEGQYGNNYLIEGFSTRDPLTKTFGVNLPMDAIQEVSVFTDGAPAEFGNFTGMVANILLKSGSNESHGSLAYGLSSSASLGEYEVVGADETGAPALVMTTKRQFFRQNPILTLQGPLVEDRIWYYTVFDFQNSQQQLEGSEVVTRTPYNYQLMGRFSWSPFQDSNTLLHFTVQNQKSFQENAYASALVAPEANVDRAFNLLALNANLKTTLSPYVVLEAKWNASERSNFDIAQQDVLLPSYTDIDTGYEYGNTHDLYSTLRTRTGFALHLTRFFTDMAGQHVVKGGFEYHEAGNEDELQFTGGIGSEEAPAYSYLTSNGVPIYRYEYRNVGPLGHLGKNYVLFLQDQWQPIPTLTLNLGLRADNESLEQNAGRTVIDQWAPAPRFGAAWDVTQDSTNVVTLNLGRYYDINGLTFAEWADTRSANYYTLCEYNPETNDFDLNCYTQDPVSNPLSYSNALTPYHMDKFTLGYSRALTPTIALGIKGILSFSRSIPEDAQFDPAHWQIINPELKRRDYRGIELTLNRSFRDNWQALASLSISQAQGTSPGSGDMGFGNGNQVGVFMDDMADPYERLLNDFYGLDFAGLGYTDYSTVGQSFEGNTEGWYGYLPEHSFVNLKLNGSYTLPFGTELGLVYELDSGHAWQRRGNILAYGSSTFPEGRGARFMPPVHYIDVRVAHTFTFLDKYKLSAELSAFNILDLQGVVNVYESWTQPDGWQTTADGSIEYFVYEGDGTRRIVNQFFGKPQFYQEPRSLRAYLKLEF